MLKCLKLSKGAGPDSILLRVIKSSPNRLPKVFTELFIISPSLHAVLLNIRRTISQRKTPPPSLNDYQPGV